MVLETPENKKNEFKDFYINHKKSFISLPIILIIIGSIYLFFDYKSKEKKTEISGNFIEAKVLLTQNNNIKSLEILKNIIFDKDKTYSPLSLFLIIDQGLEKDNNAILNYFDEVLSISNLESEDLNLLRLKKAIFISNTSKEQDMLDLLNPVINSESIWKTQSLKFLGDYYFSLKQYKKAEIYYSTLLKLNDESVDLNEIKRKIKLIQNG